MTTAQLIIVCLTVLSLAGIVAWVRRSETAADLRSLEVDASTRIRLAEWERPSLMPAIGSTLAVHFDGRVVQGTLDAADDDTLVLIAAQAFSGTTPQPLGGKQYVPRRLVTQVQELTSGSRPSTDPLPALRDAVRQVLGAERDA